MPRFNLRQVLTWIGIVGDGLERSQKQRRQEGRNRHTAPEGHTRPQNHGTEPRGTQRTDDYPGDFKDRPRISYAPINDKAPDPGEVVWTRVPFEEDPSQGKDRPVLLIGRDGQWLLALQITSKDHDLDKHQEASVGRFWEDIGSGAWDRSGRPSEARVNRVIRIDPRKVRRIGAVLDKETFDRVTERVLTFY